MDCIYDVQYILALFGLVIIQALVLLVFLGIYGWASREKNVITIPAQKYFRIELDSLKDTVFIPILLGIVISLGFLLIRGFFFPNDYVPASIPISILFVSSVVLAPIMETIADQGLIFLIVLSAYQAVSKKKGNAFSLYTPPRNALLTALIVQGAVFGILHFNDFTGFFIFKMIYTALDGLVLGYLCWANNRNLLPVMFCHAAFNITSILLQPYLLC